MTSPKELIEKLREAARSPVLLVASDYDGTLSPIVKDPSEAIPNREALVAIKALAEMPNTHVAIVSGRGIRDLARLIGTLDEVHLIGSHGSEFDAGFAESLPEQAKDLKDRLTEELTEIASRGEGLVVERKPAGAAFHYRKADKATAELALEAVLQGPASRDGVHCKPCKKVIELSVVPTDKGHALNTLRHSLGATAVLFIGDDLTDEDAFATLSGPDIGVKVGEGRTKAEYRIGDTDTVAQLLAALCEQRSTWLRGSEAVPIDAHNILSDQRTIALVAPDSNISWLCTPRIDSPALFAELIAGPMAGHFRIEALDGSKPVTQRYIDDSFLLRTKWKDFVVTDYLDCSMQRPRQRAGRTDLVRILEGKGGIRFDFSPRLDFGRVETRLVKREGGLLVEGSLDPIVLRSPGVEWEIVAEGTHHTAKASFELSGKPLVLELRYGTGNLREGSVPEHKRREMSRRYWTEWAGSLQIPEIKPDLVRRSALVLKALCYGPSGGIAAAATTSLPETLGGIRNWDYRYCWLRDAALSARALVSLGSISEAMSFLDWVLAVVDDLPSARQLRPLYQVSGQELGPEAEIAELSGYAGSRPVRIGNAASGQVQLDVFGPIVQLIHDLSVIGAPLSVQHWRLVESFAEAVMHRWTEPDHGIWEIRGRRRHHVHSKVMCWVTIDRALSFENRFYGEERGDWRKLRDEIRNDVLEHGWKPELNAFTAAYNGTDLDAAALMIGLTGLVPADDERFLATIAAIESELCEGPVVYRYLTDDGLPGQEGAFLLCSSWLIDALALVGRIDDAWSWFEDYCRLAGPTGLMAEEYDPTAELALGNFPQAYSHLGLIRNALTLAKRARD